MALGLNYISRDGVRVVVVCCVIGQNLKVNNTNDLARLVFICHSQGTMVVFLVLLLLFLSLREYHKHC